MPGRRIVSRSPNRRSTRGAPTPAGRDFDARQHLLNTAGRLMSDRDSIDVSLSEIARHSGLSSTLVKYYFGSKDGLLLALVEREAVIALGGLEALLQLKLSPTDKLRRHIAGIINNFFRTPYFNRLLHSLLDKRQRKSHGAERLRRVFVRPLLELQRRLLAQGVRAGEFRTIDPVLFHVSLLGACDHLFNARHALRPIVGGNGVTDAVRERYIAHVCDVFIGGLKVRRESRPVRRGTRSSR